MDLVLQHPEHQVIFIDRSWTHSHWRFFLPTDFSNWQGGVVDDEDEMGDWQPSFFVNRHSPGVERISQPAEFSRAKPLHRNAFSVCRQLNMELSGRPIAHTPRHIYVFEDQEVFDHYLGSLLLRCGDTATYAKEIAKCQSLWVNWLPSVHVHPRFGWNLEALYIPADVSNNTEIPVIKCSIC